MSTRKRFQGILNEDRDDIKLRCRKCNTPLTMNYILQNSPMLYCDECKLFWCNMENINDEQSGETGEDDTV